MKRHNDPTYISDKDIPLAAELVTKLIKGFHFKGRDLMYWLREMDKHGLIIHTQRRGILVANFANIDH